MLGKIVPVLLGESVWRRVGRANRSDRRHDDYRFEVGAAVLERAGEDGLCPIDGGVQDWRRVREREGNGAGEVGDGCYVCRGVD